MFAQLPTGALTHALIGIMITVFARYHEDRRQLSDAFRRILRWVLRSAVPLSVLLAIEIPVLTRLLLGENWLPMAPILRYLLLFSLCRPLLEAALALLRSIGDPRGSVGFLSVQAGILLIAVPLLTGSFAIEGTALAMNLTAMVGTILALRRCTRFVDVPWMRSFAPPLLAAAAAAGVRLLVDPFIVSLSEAVALALGILLFVLSYSAALLVLEGRTLLNEWRALRQIMRQES